MKKMKGNLYAWVVVLAFGWIVTLLWTIFTTITVEHIVPWAEENINNTESTAFLERQIDYHNYWPLIFMGGLTIYGIASSVRHEPTDSYYPA